jgi:hypothetical protein
VASGCVCHHLYSVPVDVSLQKQENITPGTPPTFTVFIVKIHFLDPCSVRRSQTDDKHSEHVEKVYHTISYQDIVQHNLHKLGLCQDDVPPEPTCLLCLHVNLKMTTSSLLKNDTRSRHWDLVRGQYQDVSLYWNWPTSTL